MNLGVIIRLREETDLDAKIKEAKEMGFDSVQFTCWQMERYTDETAETILNALKKYGVRISTFWCGWRGKESWMWNSYEGPLTLGIVPPHARFERILDLKKGSDFAKKLGVDQVVALQSYPKRSFAQRVFAFFLQKRCQNINEIKKYH